MVAIFLGLLATPHPRKVGWKRNFRGAPDEEDVCTGCTLNAGLVWRKSLSRSSACKAKRHPVAGLGGPSQGLHTGMDPLTVSGESNSGSP